MDFLRRNAKRIVTDFAGYVLVLAAPIVGLLPGPGGIALLLGGLGLLSLNNHWAKQLRERALSHGGRIVEFLFPRNTAIEWLYDSLVVAVLILASVLIWQRSAIWELSLAVAAYFTALFVALMNRDRTGVRKRKRSKKHIISPKA